MSAKKIRRERGDALAIGLMSGTSHDGVSAAIVTIDERRNPPARATHFHTYPYSANFRARLLAATSGAPVGSGELSALNFELGRAFGRAAIAVARDARVALSRIDFIGSHGHTFFHRPPRVTRRGETASTLQLGESAVIAEMTGRPVVADFRPMDIALGGEGAPLAPLAHLWLFADPRRGRVIQNIGGIGNATYIPPAARLGHSDLIAFDTGPGVGLIDALMNETTGGRMRMDRGGKIAARGRASVPMLTALMRHRYFRRSPPKSTGREEFGPPYLSEVKRVAASNDVRGDDLVATVTALTARSIADSVRRFIAPRGRVDQLIATGGGARNPTLLKMLAAEMPSVEVTTATRTGVDGDSLEAVAFAILGYQMLRGRPGNIPSVTGARAPAILGKLTLPPDAHGGR
ncbi:MAG TPA: anhydro-N-acetylmuramic acid kinase [Candidatus Binataceae bacterium]|nr:anhydro-N-acetylmuramic acid kinase [Candidatus Binataceae bacterium]